MVRPHITYQGAVAGVVADVGIPADLGSAGELPAGPASANVFLAVANRSTRPDHPSPSRAANESHTGTSRGPAIRCCTNSNADLPK